MESFGSYIKKLRIDKGLTLTQLAARFNMDSANLSKVENGKRAFDEKKLTLLADVFSLNNDEVVIAYYSDKIAREIYTKDCFADILESARHKIRLLRQENLKQDEIKFT